MAAVEEALFTHLNGTTSVTGLLGTTRSINPIGVDQQSHLPAVTIQRISGVRFHAFSDDVDASWGRFQFGSWAQSFSDAHALKEAVRNRIQRFSGTVSGVQIDDILLDGERHLFEDAIETYQLQLDAIVHYRETT